MYFYIDCIALKILIIFFLICLWVIVSKKSIILKFMHRYKLFETKNKDNLIVAKLLLFAANSTIDNFSD